MHYDSWETVVVHYVLLQLAFCDYAWLRLSFSRWIPLLLYAHYPVDSIDISAIHHNFMIDL